MRQAVWQSLLLHFGIVTVFALASLLLRNRTLEMRKVKVEIKEVTAPATPAQPVEVKVMAEPPPPTKTPPRKVFGLNRHSLQSEKGAVDVKAGNTLAKDIDQEKMRPEDADALPVPTEEYLVNQMPRLKAEVRIPYPPQAKAKNIEGLVMMDILIDDKGKVRSAQLIEGPGYGLNEAALEAIYRFEFVPAMMDKKAIAVRIRYAYRFVLN